MTIHNIKRHILRTAALALPLWGLGGFTSCEDMMTVDTGDKTYVNAQDTLYSYIGIMRAMQDVAERQVILGEIRGDLVTSTEYTTDTLYDISNFETGSKNLLDRSQHAKSCSMLQVSDYYNIINNCNFYLHNADTNAVKSNIKYMVPEYAQVKAIRAWTYLQLVKNYKAVPFITQPVSNLGVINSFNYSENIVDKNNLVDKLIDDGLLNYLDTDYPQYGSAGSTLGAFDNGAHSISARLMMIPIRVVLGDLYLLRGASTSDYEQAAKYYYEYLKKERTPLYEQYATAATRNAVISYSTGGSWGQWANTYTYSAANNEVISLIPGAANAGLGTMLTRVADIFGYTPTSSQQSNTSTTTDSNGNTSTNKDANGNDIYDASGYITVSRNHKRQYAPSNAFQDVANRQTYVIYASSTSSPTYIENCDARYGNSREDFSYEGEAYPLCCKAAKGGTFFYTIPTYRKTLVWLRLAEAINRAGYPEYAFAILKDGINQYTLPRIVDRYPEHYDEAGRLVYYNKSQDHYIYKDVEENQWYAYDENGDLVPYTDRTTTYNLVRDTIADDSIARNSHGSMYYIKDFDQIRKFDKFLSFTDEVWNSTYGIHAKGAGFVSPWTSANQGEVITNISGYNDSVYYDYEKQLLAQNVVLESASREDIINAVENIIVDELALETAFEGNRFTDLVRIAEHKNAAGYDGTEWLARKIANRGTKAASSTSAAIEGFDAPLYTKLKNPTTWYFSLPTWTTR